MLTVLTQEYLVTGVLDDVCITWLYSKLSKLMVSRTNYHFDDQDWTNSLENGLKPLVCYFFNLWQAVRTGIVSCDPIKREGGAGMLYKSDTCKDQRTTNILTKQRLLPPTRESRYLLISLAVFTLFHFQIHLVACVQQHRCCSIGC